MQDEIMNMWLFGKSWDYPNCYRFPNAHSNTLLHVVTSETNDVESFWTESFCIPKMSHGKNVRVVYAENW